MIQGTYLAIPQAGDRGSVFCPAISNNQTILDQHTHDGITSPLINSRSVIRSTISILSANWIDNGVGEFTQAINLPSGYFFDSTSFQSIISSGANIGTIINLGISKVSTTSFLISTSFSDLNATVVLT